MTTEPEPCTTSSGKKKHWSDSLSDLPGSYNGAVRRNATLCGLAGAGNQAKLDVWHEDRRVPVCRRVPICDLPECQPCLRALAARRRNTDKEATR